MLNDVFRAASEWPKNQLMQEMEIQPFLAVIYFHRNVFLGTVLCYT